MHMMKAIVVEQSGSPEVLHIRQLHRPEADHGWVLVRIRAFGLNRSEMFTRQGFSPDVTFPRILGIEAVGEVEQDPSGHYSVKLTTYQSETLDMSTAVSVLQEYVTGVEHGTSRVRLDRVFKFEEIVEAHRYMESNAATGKLVVLVD